MRTTPISEKQQWLRAYQQQVEEMLAHFDTYRVVGGSGLGPDSCCSAVLGSGAVVYGQSQAYKLDLDAIAAGRAHAEVVAYQLGETRRGQPPRVIFCELSPCPACQNRFDQIDVEIVYLFDYATGRRDWRNFHRQPLEEQIRFLRTQAGLSPR